ncbi:peptidyl-tRNA hydrolase ICT1 [Hibiscus syriacus]|uniref:Peptidyl-tRNA hydrolase ICT1 n=1 Tax=Hibiscus syriacus TaxID=106335 RepID=A0A6A2XJI8_HIBSY|nr:peptidyl-tRNA hydrolase ICT1 [Hibiscus syriacus]
MKLVWSPETASKAYIDTVKLCELYHDSGVAELVSAMAAGWNARFILETWSHGVATATSIGLAVASSHTDGGHVCIVPDERSRLEYIQTLEVAVMSPKVIVGEPEELMSRLNGIDFVVVDSQRKRLFQGIAASKTEQQGSCYGEGLDIAHVAIGGGNSGKRRWIRHIDQQSGEEYVIRK